MPKRAGKTRRARVRGTASASQVKLEGYDGLVGGIGVLVEEARRTAARRVNSILTATYWEIGRRIVEHEQRGASRAEYGQRLLKRLARDLTGRYGRGFGAANLSQMKKFYLLWACPEIFQTVSEKSGTPVQAPLATRFPLPWSAYVRLLAVKSRQARQFYEIEALRGGWSVRQLDRQIQSQFYERAELSQSQATILNRGRRAEAADAVTPEEELRDPYVLELLDLKDAYSETDFEEALIQHLESFLLELGEERQREPRRACPC